MGGARCSPAERTEPPQPSSRGRTTTVSPMSRKGSGSLRRRRVGLPVTLGHEGARYQPRTCPPDSLDRRSRASSLERRQRSRIGAARRPERGYKAPAALGGERPPACGRQSDLSSRLAFRLPAASSSRVYRRLTCRRGRLLRARDQDRALGRGSKRGPCRARGMGAVTQPTGVPRPGPAIGRLPLAGKEPRPDTGVTRREEERAFDGLVQNLPVVIAVEGMPVSSHLSCV